MVIGHPDAPQTLSQIPRLPLEAVIHHERYTDASTEKIKDLYSDKEKDFWARIEQNPKRKQEFDKNNITSCAKAYVQMKYGSKVLNAYSDRLTDFMDKHWNMLFKSNKSK